MKFLNLAHYITLIVFAMAYSTDARDANSDIQDLFQKRARASSPGKMRGRQLRQATVGKGRPVDIDSDFITINRVRYSRYGASSGDLGSFGEVLEGKDQSRTNWQGSAPEAWVTNNIKMGTRITLTREDLQTFSIGPEVSAQVAVEGIPVAEINAGVSFDLETKTRIQYSLQEILFESEVEVTKWITRYGVRCQGDITQLEDECFTLDYLHSLGDDLRIVTTAWILLPDTQELSSSETWEQCSDTKFTLAVSDTASVITGGIDPEFSRCESLSVSFSPGTVMATEASRVEWRMNPGNSEERAIPLRALRLSKDSY